MKVALLDDHLLRDLLVDDRPPELRRVQRTHRLATTNLFLYRLSRSVVASSGGAITGGWTDDMRRALGARLTVLPDDVEIVPMRTLTHRMAEIATDHRVSTLGAECLAAAEFLGATVCVWDGDVGPTIRSAASHLGLGWRPIQR